MTIRIEVQGIHAAAAAAIVGAAPTLGISTLRACRIRHLYYLENDPGPAALERLCGLLLVDPVTEFATWGAVDGEDYLAPDQHAVEVAVRPGVTDVAARELRRGITEIGLPPCAVATATRYLLEGDLRTDELRTLARQLLCNETVQHFALGRMTPHFGADAPPNHTVETVAVTTLDDDALLALSKRRLLSLDLAEMHAIQAFYQTQGREPTDVELETLAQTWSEHCVHKTFRAHIDFAWQDADGDERARIPVDGLLRQYIRAATDAVYPAWLYSAFVDNAGIIAFDDKFDLAFKVETHNHPSALEPFGGANTGVGGVVRDIIGVSARPIATTNVLCFGPQDLPHDQVAAGALHPRRIADGVVAGVADYGNKLGLPTVNGAVFYDEGYLGNPLVFCGCVGILPHGSHPTAVQPGDLIVALGGRTGRDGLHGATFSSVELTHETSESSGSAVQIGDPITEKGLIELIEAARDALLYTAITDCGAGGFSSAIGEMGRELGADVDLTAAPLKYTGLAPWEIWLSEAQERMVLAVPSENLAELQDLAALWDVELSVLGSFPGDGVLRVRSGDVTVAELPMDFLHDGLPRRYLMAIHREPAADLPVLPALDGGAMLLAMLRNPNIASKEAIVRRYDHEVRGGTIVRPFTGPHMDGPADAAMLKPLGTWEHAGAFVISAGINPQLGRRDPYAMAVSAIDEAVRNAVAVGGDPDRVALLDNFCWGNPMYPDRLGALVRACQGCYDGALAYNAPFISGKDSLYNEFNGVPIPGTLLISAITLAPDMARSVTSDLKRAGNLLYVVGASRVELGGSLLYALHEVEGGAAPTMPDAPLVRYRALHTAMREGLVQACHDCSEGGLAVALAEMALGGRLGIDVDLSHAPGAPDLDDAALLFGESNGRMLVEVAPDDISAFEAALAHVACAPIGRVAANARVNVRRSGAALLDLPLAEVVQAWTQQA